MWTFYTVKEVILLCFVHIFRQNLQINVFLIHKFFGLKKRCKFATACNSIEKLFTNISMENLKFYFSAFLALGISFQSLYSADFYCAPGAKGSGTEADPGDVSTAITKIGAGETIYLKAGVYELGSTILIKEDNCGAAGKYKTIRPMEGAEVVFDYSKQSVGASNRGFVLDGDYWHFYGFTIQNAGDNGMLLSGNNNIIEMMVFNDNEDTGLQISRYNTSNETLASWPSYNLVKNCTSKNNCDEATMENADGFAAKLTCGEGNVFDGCMAYNNSDDGWDLYAKEATGPIGVVTIKNSIAFRNGYTEDGRGYGDCDGNGFKLGGAGVGTAHKVDNCLAFENYNCGFTDNNNPKLGSISNCTAFNNNVSTKGKPNFSVYRCTNCDFDNLISYYTKNSCNDKYVGTYNNGVYYNSGYYKVLTDTQVSNGSKIGTKFTGFDDNVFISLNVGAMGTDFHKLWRNEDGSLNPKGFAETKLDGEYASMGYRMSNGDLPTPEEPVNPEPEEPEVDDPVIPETPDDPVYTEAPTITKRGSGSSTQTITLGEAIQSFGYSFTNADGLEFVGLPEGLEVSPNGDGRMDVSGTPVAAGEYTVTVKTVGGLTEVTKNFTIKVSEASDVKSIKDKCLEVYSIGNGAIELVSSVEKEVDVTILSMDGLVILETLLKESEVVTGLSGVVIIIAEEDGARSFRKVLVR